VKKPVKVLIFSLGILLLMISATVASIYIASNARIGRSFIVTAGHIPVFKSPADLAEGERLYVSRGCGDCHGVDAGGKTFIDDPAIGRITGSNLTSGKGGVGSARSNEDFARALRHGVGQNSRALVFMPSTDFTTMTDEDAGKLISFVRTMPAVDREAPQTRIGPLARLLFLTGQMPLLVSAEKIDHNAKPQAKLSPAVNVEYGKYVAATCTGCHRDNLQGGPIQGAPPEWPPAQNIAGKALAHYDEAQFTTALRTGKRPDGSDIKFPMPWQSLSKLTDTEVRALWKYLQTL
jgi:mono/diheme cytochrome c family protein